MIRPLALLLSLAACSPVARAPAVRSTPSTDIVEPARSEPSTTAEEVEAPAVTVAEAPVDELLLAVEAHLEGYDTDARRVDDALYVEVGHFSLRVELSRDGWERAVDLLLYLARLSEAGVDLERSSFRSLATEQGALMCVASSTDGVRCRRAAAGGAEELPSWQGIPALWRAPRVGERLPRYRSPRERREVSPSESLRAALLFGRAAMVSSYRNENSSWLLFGADPVDELAGLICKKESVGYTCTPSRLSTLSASVPTDREGWDLLIGNVAGIGGATSVRLVSLERQEGLVLARMPFGVMTSDADLCDDGRSCRYVSQRLRDVRIHEAGCIDILDGGSWEGAYAVRSMRWRQVHVQAPRACGTRFRVRGAVAEEGACGTAAPLPGC